ncbi:TM2 domain-containing protein [Candidatus Saccharibacteria bacterium]|nr:MAG: TM2 domain-containing protein [Candidatus Saccharibacteria bacterium]
MSADKHTPHHTEHKQPEVPRVTLSPGLVQTTTQPKRFSTAVLLSLFLGGFGFDRFYLGYTGLGVTKILTFGGLGIWAFIDCILILTGKLGPADGSKLTDRQIDKKPMTIAVIVVYIVSTLNLLTVGAFLGFVAYQAATNPDFFKNSTSHSKPRTPDVNVYDKLTVGMTKAEVAQAFDGSGYESPTCTKRADRTGKFEDCSYTRYAIFYNSSTIYLTFENDRLAEKSEYDSTTKGAN